MRTVLELLNLAQDYLGKHGVERPRLDSEILLGHVTGKKRLELYLDYNQPLSESEVELFREYTRQRAQRKPVQHIIGETEFFGLRFKVNENALIPRPETELLVEKVIEHIDRNALQFRGEIVIFDVGTGSGCIAVSLAKKLNGARIYASDVSNQALSLARQNAQSNSVESDIELLEGDLEQAFVSTSIPRSDILVSNAPYISEPEWAELAPEVVEYEPKQALYGGADGLEVIRKIIPAGLRLLKQGGWIFLEIGWKQAAKVEDLFREAGDYCGLEFIQDYSGIRRIVKAQKA